MLFISVVLIARSDLPFTKTGHLLNAWNEDKPVKIGRDGQVSILNINSLHFRKSNLHVARHYAGVSVKMNLGKNRNSRTQFKLLAKESVVETHLRDLEKSLVAMVKRVIMVLVLLG